MAPRILTVVGGFPCGHTVMLQRRPNWFSRKKGPRGTGTVLLARARPPPSQPGGSQRRDPGGLAEPGPPWATWSTNATTNQHVPECPCSRSSSCRRRTPTLRGATANRTPEPPHPATGLQVRILPCWWAVAPGEARRHLQPWSPALPAWRPSVGRQQRQKPEEPRHGLAPPRSLVRGGPWSPKLGGPGAWRRWHGSSGSRTSPRARVCRAQARGVAHTQPCRTPHATEVPSHVSASEPRKLQPETRAGFEGLILAEDAPQDVFRAERGTSSPVPWHLVCPPRPPRRNGSRREGRLRSAPAASSVPVWQREAGRAVVAGPHRLRGQRPALVLQTATTSLGPK